MIELPDNPNQQSHRNQPVSHSLSNMSDTVSGESDVPSSSSVASSSVAMATAASVAKKPAAVETESSSLLCGICKHRYADPRLLACLHTYCGACLKSLAVPHLEDRPSSSSSLSSLGSGLTGHSSQISATIRCPACEEETELPSGGGLESLPVDFGVRRRLTLDCLNSGAGETPCDLCTDGSEAVSRCLECGANVCTFCGQAHQRQRKTAGHTLLSLAEARQGLGKGSGAFTAVPAACPRHPSEELRLFCETCQLSACRDCCLVEHREHLVEYADDVAAHHRRVLSGLVARLHPHLQAIGAGIGAVNRAEVAVADRDAELHHEVSAYFDGYIQALQSHRRNLLTRLAQISDGRIQSLQTHRLQLQRLMRDMQHACSVANRALADSSNQELLAIKPAIGGRLGQLNRASYQCSPQVDGSLRFKARAKAGKVNSYEVQGVLEAKQLDPLKCFLRGEGVHEARQGMVAEFLLITVDVDGQPYHKGGEDVRATLAVESVRNRMTNCQIFDEEDGSYRVEYTPVVHATHVLSVFLDGQHIKGSPFKVTVHEGWREHPGLWHCCTFCSSEGSRQATCACGGRMPGGFKGCGHGHPGHPGKWHWSCCGLAVEDSECLAERPHASSSLPQPQPAAVVTQGSSAGAGAGIGAPQLLRPGMELGTLVRREAGPITGRPGVALAGHAQHQATSAPTGQETLPGKGREKQVHAVSL